MNECAVFRCQMPRDEPRCWTTQAPQCQNSLSHSGGHHIATPWFNCRRPVEGREL
jgi:hypothetical protein